MKKILSFIFGMYATLLIATDLPNTGKAQNKYGFYGEGVLFGSIEIIGSWTSSCSNEITTFDNNGSTIYTTPVPTSVTYGVSEDGTTMIINVIELEQELTILQNGNNGCLHVDVETKNMSVNFNHHEQCNMCKVAFGSKTYGPSTNVINITVGTN